MMHWVGYLNYDAPLQDAPHQLQQKIAEKNQRIVYLLLIFYKWRRIVSPVAFSVVLCVPLQSSQPDHLEIIEQLANM